MPITLAFVVAAVATAAWAGLYGLVLLFTRSGAAAPAAATMELGVEPPAVVNLLTNRWTRPDEDAAEATLLDLAARRYYEIRQPDADPVHSTIHLNPQAPAGTDLVPFERRLLDRIRAAAAGGVVPLTALTFRDEKQASGWRRRFDAEVVAHARRLGLSRRRISKSQVTLLSVAALVPSVAIAVAFGLLIERNAAPDDEGGGYGAIVVFTLMLLTAFGAFAGRYRGERETPQGSAAASHWLGVRAWLGGHDAFADLPPAAVAVWDRYIGYGAALGVSHAATAALDLGMGSKRLVWSSYGGTWHRVRVRYPRWFDRYGQKTSKLVKGGIIRIAIGVGLVWLSRYLPDVVPAQIGFLDTSFAGRDISEFTSPTRLAALALGALVIVWGVYRLVRGIADHYTPVALTGEVLWVSVWRSTSGGENSPAVPWLHHLAIDEGTSDRTVAWGLPSEWARRTSPGDVVRVQVRRWTRRVAAIEVVQHGGGHHQGFETTDNTDNLVLEALGERKPSSSPLAVLHRPATTLLTADEVSRAVGLPVVARDAGPVMGLYDSADRGRTVVMVQMHTGMLAQLWRAAGRRGTPVPGVGDEAYMTDTGATMRKGATVVAVILHGPGRAAAPHLPWLLGQMAGRL